MTASRSSQQCAATQPPASTVSILHSSRGVGCSECFRDWSRHDLLTTGSNRTSLHLWQELHLFHVTIAHTLHSSRLLHLFSPLISLIWWIRSFVGPTTFGSIDHSWLASVAFDALLPNVTILLQDISIVCRFLTSVPCRCGITWETILASTSLGTNQVHLLLFQGLWSFQRFRPPASYRTSTHFHTAHVHLFIPNWVHILWLAQSSSPRAHRKLRQFSSRRLL